MNPINLSLRFLLELATLAAVVLWGWIGFDGLFKYLVAIVGPIMLMVIWGTFAVPGDPSRSGKTVVPTPGIVRLILELAFFSTGVYALYDLDKINLAVAFIIALLVHHVFSLKRLKWLISQ